jgi:hypothetical protein
MGCEALPIEYYDSLAEKGSSSFFLPAKPIHKKTPIGVFFNIVILCLRYFNPLNDKWLSRDTIAEKGGINLYGFVGNDAVNKWDYLGFAPNQEQTTDPTKVLADVKASVEKYTSDGVCNIDKVLDNLRDISSDNKRYLYSRKYGWIDLRHFFEAANYSEDIGSVVTEILGFGNEIFQWLGEWEDDYRSGFSYEDLPSNHAGAEFGDDYSCTCSSLEKDLNTYFDSIGVLSDNDPDAKKKMLPSTDPSLKGPAYDSPTN